LVDRAIIHDFNLPACAVGTATRLLGYTARLVNDSTLSVDIVFETLIVFELE
jgi:hypothetical protein